MRCDILIAGVGGQGTVLASRLLAASAIEAGMFVRTSETIGMAQRGGCVASHVRIGSEYLSPIVSLKKADILIGFEPAEAVRNFCRLSLKGKCVINTKTIQPVTASLSGNSYEGEPVLDYLKSKVQECILVDGYEVSAAAGSVKALNVTLLGVACKAGYLPFDTDTLKKAIKNNMASKYVNLNINALKMGMDYKCI